MAYEKMQSSFPCMCGNGKVIAEWEEHDILRLETGALLEFWVPQMRSRLRSFIPVMVGSTSFGKLTPRGIAPWSRSMRRRGARSRLLHRNTDENGLVMSCLCRPKAIPKNFRQMITTDVPQVREKLRLARE